MGEAPPGPRGGQIRWLDPGPARRSWRGWHTALAAVLAVGAAVAVWSVASHAGRRPASRFRITSGSMQPTLTIGQVVEVDRHAYATSPPSVGDVVAFYAPAGATARRPLCGVAPPAGEACGRSTPVESDQVFVKRIVAGPGDTVAVVDGAVVRNGVLQPAPFAAGCSIDIGCNFPVAVKVPPGEWFMMGDNRDRSDDSRYWGPVPTAWIVGRVVG